MSRCQASFEIAGKQYRCLDLEDHPSDHVITFYWPDEPRKLPPPSPVSYLALRRADKIVAEALGRS